MLVTYMRSSSYGCFSFCPAQYYFSYVLGLRANKENGWTIPTPQSKADQGNALHKSLELLAHKKLATQNGHEVFSEDEIGKTWKVDEFGIEDAFREGWEHYALKRCPHWGWGEDIKDKVRGWYDTVLSLNGGMWNPLNRDVVRPEQYFDFEIDKPWAEYRYNLPDGTPLIGKLALKGTVDLITRVSEDTFELLDWKSGLRKDWATGQVKDWKKLRNDPQLRIYYYALRHLYPDIRHIIVTIVFAQDGGAFSLDFGPEDIPKTESMLRERFEVIKNCQRPPRIKNDPAQKWKCERLCEFGINKWKDSGQTVCDFLHGEMLTLGLDRVTAKYGNPNAFKNYGSGGGVENRDVKQEK